MAIFGRGAIGALSQGGYKGFAPCGRCQESADLSQHAAAPQHAHPCAGSVRPQSGTGLRLDRLLLVSRQMPAALQVLFLWCSPWRGLGSAGHQNERTSQSDMQHGLLWIVRGTQRRIVIYAPNLAKQFRPVTRQNLMLSSPARQKPAADSQVQIGRLKPLRAVSHQPLLKEAVIKR